MKNKRKGISLITLVVTIIVIVIIAGAVILNMSSNNPVDSANKAVVMQDIDTFKSELNLKIASEFANMNISSTNDINLIGESMYTYIPSMEGKTAKGTQYKDILAIVGGKLVMGERVSIDEDLSSWIFSALGGLTVSEVESSIRFESLSKNKVLGTEPEIISVINGGDGVVTYSTSNENVATVNSSTGELSAIGIGTAIITATVADGEIATYSQKTATYTVTVDTVTVSWAKSNLTSTNISTFQGTKVDYHPETDSTGIYRIFYLDEEGKYGDGVGTVYIKRDYESSTKVKDSDYRTYYTNSANQSDILSDMRKI